MSASQTPSVFSRRTFLGFAGAATALPLLAACSSGGALSAGMSVVDGTPASQAFAQTMLAGNTDAKQALQTFQSAIEAS